MLHIPSLLAHEVPTHDLQGVLDSLASNSDWETLLEKVPDLSLFSRVCTTHSGRSLLHLAVIDGRTDVVKSLSANPFMRQNRDCYGLNPLEIAQFLGMKEIATLLDPYATVDRVELPLKSFDSIQAPVFEQKEHLEMVLHWTAKAKSDDAIPAEKIWMGVYFDKEIQRGLHAQVTVRHVSEEVGFGVFAEKKILPCSFVGEYTGLIQERDRKKIKGKKYVLRYTLWEAKKQFTIDAENMGNFTRFINHSSNPNLGLQSVYWRGLPRMIFVALKEIEPGAQLTFDYGSFFWKEFDQEPYDL